ncbi:hypothetical protein C0J52_07266 [Blattella germanica]|nr:hypothetical protein C0J52_07266 [Blattella germanica]
MDTSRVVVFASLFVISALCLVSSGSALPKPSDEKWRPVSFQNEQSITRRSYDTEEDTARDADSSSWLPSIGGAEYRVVQKVLDDCFKSGDGISCLKGKAITFLDRVSKIKSLPLFEGIALAKQEDGTDDAHVLTENELEASLPRNLDKKNDQLDQMIYDRLVNFWKSHTFVFDFSSDAVAEGRRKKHKKMGFLVMAMAAAAATIGPLALKGLAALAFKALLVAKVALVLASAVALKKLSHHGGEHRSYVESHEDSWVHNAQGRSFSVDDNEEAHKMAYSGHLRRPITVTVCAKTIKMHQFVLYTCLVVFVLCVSTSALPRSEYRKASRRFDNGEETERAAESSSSWFPSVGSAEYKVLQRVLDDCIKSGDGVNCLKGRAVTFLDRVSKLESIPLFDGVALSKQDNADTASPVLNEAEIEASLPRDLSQKSDRLDQMIYERLTNFWNGHSLVFDFASQDAVEVCLKSFLKEHIHLNIPPKFNIRVLEGPRKKHKRLMGHVLMGLAAAAATVGPIAFKGLAALALKALIAAKIALVLASIIAFKSLGHHGGDSHRSYAFEETEHGGDHWMAERYGRSYAESTTEQAHKMAYSAQLQRPITVA